MNGKIELSIVATALHGSNSKPYLNLVDSNNGSHINRGFDQGDSLFSTNHIDKNISASIDGATALKLDETFEVKNTEEQNALIDSFESNEENRIAEGIVAQNNNVDEVPAGVSIESASYMENNSKSQTDDLLLNEKIEIKENLEEVYTPKLFSDDNNHEEVNLKDLKEIKDSQELFDQDTNEDEDFEIPAFLRRKVLMIKLIVNERSNIITGIFPSDVE